MFSYYKRHWEYILHLKFQSFFRKFYASSYSPISFAISSAYYIPVALRMLEEGPSWTGALKMREYKMQEWKIQER